jgi:nitrogen regulatory protein PII
MKKIEMILRPTNVDAVAEALVRNGVQGITLTRVRGCGRQKGQSIASRGASYVVDLLPKVKLEVLAHDEQVEEIIKIVETCARSGWIGDGKIMVSPIEQGVRIRTGERGEQAV